MRPNRVARLVLVIAIVAAPWAINAGAIPVQEPARPGPHPLHFVPNAGQFDGHVRFRLREPGKTWWFTDEGIWLTVVRGTQGTEGTEGTPSWSPCPTGMLRNHPVPLSPGQLRSTQHAARSTSRPLVPLSPCPLVSLSAVRGVNLHLTFPGMNPTAHLAASDPQPAKMNYFHGPDPSRWHSNVPTYAALHWYGLYDHIDLAFEQTGQGFSLRLETASRADLNRVRVQIEGADSVRTNAGGYLIADTALGSVNLPALLNDRGDPFQPMLDGNSVSLSAPISTLYSPISNHQSPANDPDDLQYSTYLGGSDDECEPRCDIALDADGSTYLAGDTVSTDFPTTPGAFSTYCNDCGRFDADVYVTKLSPDGTDLVYSTYIGGSWDDCGFSCALAVDPDGAAYITGATWSTDFPTTPGVIQPNCEPGCDDTFVTKLSPDGSSLVYSTYLTGGPGTKGNNIAVNTEGEAYVIGWTGNPNYPVTPGVYQTTLNGWIDAFITKLNGSGTALVYSTFLGGSADECDNESNCAIVVDPEGAAYLTGATGSPDFPTTPGVVQPECIPSGFICDGAFVTKLSPTGSTLVFSTYLGGSYDQCGSEDCDIAVDASGAVYIGGTTNSPDFPTTPGSYHPRFYNNDPYCDKYEYCFDGFVTKLNSTGTTFVYSTYLGGFVNDGLEGIVVDAAGHALVTGWTGSGDFPTTLDGYDNWYHGGRDVFLTELATDGSDLVYSTFLGGGGFDTGYGLALDPAGLVYVTGATDSSDFPTTLGAYDTSYAGGTYSGDTFVSKLRVNSWLSRLSTPGPIRMVTNTPTPMPTMTNTPAPTWTPSSTPDRSPTATSTPSPIPIARPDDKVFLPMVGSGQ